MAAANGELKFRKAVAQMQLKLMVGGTKISSVQLWHKDIDTNKGCGYRDIDIQLQQF